MYTGSRSGVNGPTPPVGRNQYMTWRSTVSETPRSASSSGAHAPGQITSRPAVYSPAAVVTPRSPAGCRRPAQHRFTEPKVGAVPFGQAQVRRDGQLGPDEPRHRLVEPDLVVGWIQGGEAPADLRRLEQIVRQSPLLRRPQAAGH